MLGLIGGFGPHIYCVWSHLADIRGDVVHVHQVEVLVGRCRRHVPAGCPAAAGPRTRPRSRLHPDCGPSSARGRGHLKLELRLLLWQQRWRDQGYDICDKLLYD